MAFGLCLLLVPLAPATGEQKQPEQIVPVEQAAYHQQIFSDEDFAILNNRFPAGGNSGYHAHYRDLFYVVIQPARTTSQASGREPAEVPMPSAGAGLYSPVGSAPRIHRVVNIDTKPYQIIAIELRRAHPLSDATASRDSAPQYVRIFENPRMQAWRLVLEPGQSAPAITQSGRGVRVVVRGGLLGTTFSDQPEQMLALHSGDFAVQPVGQTRALRNGGSETIELVEIELK